MFTHFFYDITHFDSSFFTSIKDLIIKPGFLSKEYMLGRRARYLHPVRMYVFTSAVFFLMFFSVFKGKDPVAKVMDAPIDSTERSLNIVRFEKALKKAPKDTALINSLRILKDTSHLLTNQELLKMQKKGAVTVNFADKIYTSVEEYDSVQKLKPPSKRDNWIERRFSILGINVSRQFREDPDGASHRLADSILHKLPYLLLISLPFFAGILKLVYVRRKQFYYADHGVFTIHLYVFSFVTLLLVFGIDRLWPTAVSNLKDVIEITLMCGLLLYLFLAMRRFYEQSWGKTFAKFMIVAFFSLMMMIVLLLILFLFSAATL
jgi:hypothetical protein